FLVFEQKGRDLSLPPEHVFFKFIHAQKQEMLIIFAITSVIVVTLIVWHGVRFSHRIAGPLYRLNTDMRQMAKDGKVRNIRFRKGDYFLELPDAFNALLDKIGPEPDRPDEKDQ